MPTSTKTWSLELSEEFGHSDFTGELREFVSGAAVATGMVVVSLVGSTGAITTIEYESGALADLCEALSRIAPREAQYQHDARWGDGNGFSHVRSAVLKTSITIPIVQGEPQLGTWQQVVVLNLDNRSRRRQVVAVAVGD